MTNFRISNAMLILLLLSAMLSGCQSLVPATIPPQLSHTPGVPITITDNQIDAGWFTLNYPDGWRIVTNVAIEPLRLTLVSPDDSLIIYVEQLQGRCIFPESTPEPGTYWRDACPSIDDRFLHIWGIPEIEYQDIYDPIFDAVINSVRFR